MAADLADDARPPPRRRKHTDLLQEDDALTKTQVMLARGYIRDPDTGKWRIPPEIIA